ncbi:MAG: glycosyltransferase family 2 protein [Anaerolineales bacterium]
MYHFSADAPGAAALSVTDAPPRIAAVIPARNEAAVIAGTVVAARRTLDTIFVVADGCTDDTAARARATGATVAERTHCGASSKAAALRWFGRHAGAEILRYDVVVVLDADSRLAPDFARALRNHVAPPDSAWQCRVSPADYRDSPVALLAALSETMEQCVADRLRAALGWPVRLRGAGMAFRPDVFLAACRELHTEVEDVALSLVLTARGIPVRPIRAAVVHDPKPRTVEAAARQRARWYRGQWRALWQYRRSAARILLRGPAGWSLLSELFLKPRWLVLFMKFVALLLSVLARQTGASILTAALVAVDLSAYAFAVRYLPAGFPRRVRLRNVWVYIRMWMTAFATAARPSTWLRARE